MARRKRKNPDKTMWLLLLAGGGAAYYFLVHRPKKLGVKLAASVNAGAAAAAAATAAAAKSGMTSGTAFKAAWDAAKTERNEYFVVQDKSGNSLCFRTSDGMPVSIDECRKHSLAGVDSTLSSRGYGSLGGIAGTHTLSSRGYGSLS